MELRCAKCGYNLAGLPYASVCPECGNAFNKRAGQGVRYPETDIDRSDRIVKRIKLAVIVVITLVTLTCCGGMGFALQKPLLYFLGALIALILMMWAVSDYISETE